MLMVHKLIDAMGTKPNPRRIMPVHIDEPHLQAMLEEIRKAEKFEFTHVPVELINVDKGYWGLPTVTTAERECWALGLLPLPAPVVWYEMTVGTRLGILVREIGTRWIVTRFDYVDDQAAWTGMQIGIDRATCTGPDFNIHASVYGDPKNYNEKWIHDNDNKLEAASGDAWLGIYLTLMLNSRTSSICAEIAPLKLNKKRVANDKTPLYTHRTVRIVPKRFSDAAVAAQGGTHASPRLHWRRSHKRHYTKEVPSAKFLEHEVHNDVTGWWTGVVPRCLVGKAELGTVDHDYRVE